MNFAGHFKTITRHKFLVMKYCFQVGLIRQGLLHDLSKYAPSEFLVGAKYYTGTKSPNAAERQELGYSTAWLHHKGRNKHHLEYWIDYSAGDFQLTGNPMPTRYMVELCLDRIAACRVYHGDRYTDRDPLEYLNCSNDAKMMHPVTRRQVVEILTMLAEKGQKVTFRYIRNVILKNKVSLYKNLDNPPENAGDKDSIFIGDYELEALVQRLGTPFYLYDEAGIVDTAEKLSTAFCWNRGYRNFYPVKACPTAAILKRLRACGQGAVVSSAAELLLVSRCGFEKKDILFLPNYPRREDIAVAAEIGCMPVLDGPSQLYDFAEYGLLGDTLGIRLIPDEPFRFGGNEVRMDGMKFGMTMAAVKELLPELKRLGVRKLGLHAYLSGNTLDAEYYPRLAAFLCASANDLASDFEIDYINLSGGLGIPYKPGQNAVDFQETSAQVRAIFEKYLSVERLQKLKVFTEIGRALTGPYGLLITRVNSVKYSNRRYAGVDASAADLMRPMMYGAYHHISVNGCDPSLTREKWDVVGAVCENTDKFAENRMLVPLKVGDILRIHDVGAHGHSMGYNYGGRLRPAEYMLGLDGDVRCIRRAETTGDYLATQIFA